MNRRGSAKLAVAAQTFPGRLDTARSSGTRNSDQVVNARERITR